jgi:hypothetical protein
MPREALPDHLYSARLLRQYDLVPEEYAAYLIEIIGLSLCQRWPGLRWWQQRVD